MFGLLKNMLEVQVEILKIFCYLEDNFSNFINKLLQGISEGLPGICSRVVEDAGATIQEFKGTQSRLK